MLSVSRRGVIAASPGPRGSCGNCGGSCDTSRDDRGELHDGESEEGDGGEEWWAGEEFEEEWMCIFEAYCPEGLSGRLSCFDAREVKPRENEFFSSIHYYSFQCSVERSNLSDVDLEAGNERANKKS